MQVKYNIKADQQPGDEDEDKTRHQLHEHAVEPEVDGQHVVGGDPRVLQKASIEKGKQRRRKTMLHFVLLLYRMFVRTKFYPKRPFCYEDSPILFVINVNKLLHFLHD